MKIAAAYIRVSTEEQTELSPDSQIKLIRDYAKAHELIVPDDFIFRDDGISGRTAAKRPGFNKMIGTAKLKPRPFDAILLWKFSRFARNREDSIVYKSMLRKLGIEVISISENIGDDKMSVLIEAMIEAMDEYYSINLAEEVKRGMLEKLSRGQIVNAPPIGYTLKDGQYIPDDNAWLVKRIYNEFLSGKPYLSIARGLNDEGYRTLKGNSFENRTIEYILRNPTYAGKLRWTPGGGGSRSHYHADSEVMVVDGTHEPLISPDLWQKAQNRAADIKARYPKYSRPAAVKNDYMLRGLLKCSSCGATLVHHKDGYQCHKYCHGHCQESHYISTAKIDCIVIDGIESALDNPNIKIIPRTAKAIEQTDKTEQTLKKEYDKLQRVKEAYAAGIDTLEEYKINKERITKDINRLKQKLEKSTNVKLSNEQLRKAVNEKAQHFLKLAADPEATQSELNQSLREFVQEIVFDKKGDMITIFYYT